MNKSRTVKGMMIAGTQSGAGKTTVTLGLLAALKRRGLRVAAFKVGPDFIDPGHHERIIGRPSRNLDGWMLSRETNRACFEKGTADADVAVVEGVMGLYDGYDGKTEAGSTAQMAKWLGLPVMLVVNARSMARSAAALIRGFEDFDPLVRFAGIFFNHLGSRRHLAYLEEAMADHTKSPCIGGITDEADIALPERHLGLVTRQDHALTDETIARLAQLMEDHIDIPALLETLPEFIVKDGDPMESAPPLHPERVRLGVARDRAFCFYYPENLERLATAGAQLVFFSPTVDTRLPEALDGLYFGGGYPELHAEALAANQGMRNAVLAVSHDGMPIYGECGGLMYLCHAIEDTDGRVHPMTGCFPFSTIMGRRRSALGYREITLAADTLLGPAGRTIRGHEFHYSHASDIPDGLSTVYQVADRRETARKKAGAPGEGYQCGNTLGSYIHLHWGSCPEAAQDFIGACRAYRKQRKERT